LSDAKQNYHRLRLKARRKLRKQRKQVERAAVQADDSLEKLVFKRMTRLLKVKRFVFVWVALVLLIGLGSIWQVRGLDKYYMRVESANGGTYREGILGTFTTANPLFAVSAVDVSVCRLVFSGLFQLAPGGVLKPDLARSYSVDDKGLVYTVKLREDVTWHDGEKFTAGDVVFTYNSIKNPDAKSPLFTSWRDVTVTAIDDYTVVFKLPNALASFKYSLVNGIVPEHILRSVEAADLRSSLFSSSEAIGTGPFKFSLVEFIGDIDERHEKITLETNKDYHQNRAKIDSIVIRTYTDEELLKEAFASQEIIAVTGLRIVPEDLEPSVQVFNTPLLSSVMVFMNNSKPFLGDKSVRRALVQATDTDAIRRGLGYPTAAVDSPFLKSDFAYDESKVQFPYNPGTAGKLLDEAGWKLNDEGKREKDGKILKLRLVSQSLSEYTAVVQELQKQWRTLGITVDAVLQPEVAIQSDAISRHGYDILLYGIAIGPDPDVFAYWHSSQADKRLLTRLNLSEFKNDTADEALEAGRTRSAEDLRKIKYAPFLDIWRDEAPAIGLYQPRFLFIASEELTGYETGQFSTATDRYYSVTQWQVRREKTVK